MKINMTYETEIIINDCELNEEYILIDITFDKPIMINYGFIIKGACYHSEYIEEIDSFDDDDAEGILYDIYNNLHLLKLDMYNVFEDYSDMRRICNLEDFEMNKKDRENLINYLKRALIEKHI